VIHPIHNTFRFAAFATTFDGRINPSSNSTTPDGTYTVRRTVPGGAAGGIRFPESDENCGRHRSSSMEDDLRAGGPLR
jgi:hypothetical protein